MKQAAWLTEGIVLGNQFHYRKKIPWKHNLLNLSMLTLMLMSVLALVNTSRWLHPAVYVPLVSLGLGVVFFGLIILVVHEASHQMFIITQERQAAARWNRVAGWMVALPFAIHYGKHWEEGHQLHHLHPVEPLDPQTRNLFTGREFVRIFLLSLLIPGYVFLWNPNRQYREARWITPVNLLLWTAIVALTVQFLPWWSTLAYLGGIQTLGALNQLKGSLEHGGEVALHPNRNLRSRTSFFPLRWLIMPLNISLHFEHHLNYCVPWYELMNYHQALRPRVPIRLQSLIFNEHVLDQVLGKLGGVQGEEAEVVTVSQELMGTGEASPALA
ncbi:MAG: fatty acid desaturase [Myxococcota bacterium]